jgi:hypothetical protein
MSRIHADYLQAGGYNIRLRLGEMDQNSTAPAAGPGRRLWRPGESGTPLGPQRLNVRTQEVFDEIRGDFVEDLPAVDVVLLRQACRLLARGERLRDLDAAVKLSAEARRIITALPRKARQERNGRTLAAYLASRDGGGGNG